MTTTRADRQALAGRSLRLYSETVDRIQKYADEHAMSRSEVVRMAMDRFAEGRVKTRSRTKRRVELWIPDPSLYNRFSRKVERDKIQIADAVEAAFALMEEEG